MRENFFKAFGIVRQRAQQAKPRIIHIPQFHPAAPGHEDQLSEADRRDVLRSQHAIAKFFWDKPEAIVFVEGLMENLRESARDEFLREMPDLAYFRKSFESGLPERVEDLTGAQREILTTFMAVPVLWVLGRLKNAYSTGHREAQRALIQKAARILEKGEDRRLFRHFAFTKRENLAIKQIRDFLRGSRRVPGEVYLVFGAAHVFPACDERLELGRAA